MASQFGLFNLQILDTDGTPLEGGRLYTYTAGTTTHKVAYTDAAASVAHTYTSDGAGGQYIALNSRGELPAPLFGTSGAYDILLKRDDGTTVWSRRAEVVADASSAAVSALETTLAGNGTGQGGHAVGFILDGTGPTDRDLMEKGRDFATIEDFLGDSYDYTTDDASAAITTASAWSSTNRRPVHFSRRYRIANPAVVTADDVKFVFNSPTFDLLDTGSDATTVSGATGKIGLHFKEADRLKITGEATFVGQGSAGFTSLLGVLFDSCDDVSAPAFMRFENMAIGRGIWSCVRSTFGDLQGNVMNGLQPFESPPTNNAGTLELFIGCSDVTSGNAVGIEIEKPTRYFSVASGSTDNKRVHVGATSVTSVAASDTSQAATIRSLVDGSLGPVTVDSVAVGVLIQQQSTDGSYNVDRVHIASVTGTAAATAASVDALVSQETVLSSKPIGTVSIGHVAGVCDGTYGIACTSGRLNIGSADLSGAAARLVAVFASTGEAALRFGKLTIHDNSVTTGPVSIGNSGLFEADIVDFRTGPSAAAVAGIRYESGLGSGSFLSPCIGTVRYRQNGSSNNYDTVIRDTTHGFEQWRVQNTDGSGASGFTVLGSNNFEFRNGQVLTGAAPTTGTYSRGTVVWFNTAAAAGDPGAICTTAGTPGTWKAFANVDA